MSKILLRTVSLFAIIGLFAAIIIPNVGTTGGHVDYSGMAMAKLRSLHHLWSIKTQSGSRYKPISSLKDLDYVESGRFSRELQVTPSRYTGRDTHVVYFPAMEKRPGYDSEDILFCYRDPVVSYKAEAGREKVPRYFAITYSGNTLSLTESPFTE